MKQAKRHDFLARQRACFQLFCDQRSQATGLPGRADFYRWAWQALKNEYRCAEIGLLLCDEDEARAYNRDYRGKDYATNVLSFAVDEAEPWLPHEGCLRGDLVLCPAVVAREAMAQGKALDQHYAHLTVHGVLHLMGYDHVTEADAETMEALEIRILHQLGYANPYIEDED